jgi:hypothetical protein
MNMNRTIKYKVNFINSFRNEGLSPSCIDLSFDGFGSISWHSIWYFRLFLTIFGLPTFFRPKYHWRDYSSRNAHLVHQNGKHICFTSTPDPTIVFSGSVLSSIRFYIWFLDYVYIFTHCWTRYFVSKVSSLYLQIM